MSYIHTHIHAYINTYIPSVRVGVFRCPLVRSMQRLNDRPIPNNVKMTGKELLRTLPKPCLLCSPQHSAEDRNNIHTYIVCSHTYMYITYVYICMSVYVRIYMYVCIYTYVYVCMYMYVRICMCVTVYVCVYMYA